MKPQYEIITNLQCPTVIMANLLQPLSLAHILEGPDAGHILYVSASLGGEVVYVNLTNGKTYGQDFAWQPLRFRPFSPGEEVTLRAK